MIKHRENIVVPLRDLRPPLISGNFPPDLDHARHTRRRRVDGLEIENRRLRDQIRFKDRVLQDEVEMWKLGLDHAEWETIGQITRRISRLKGAIEYGGFAD